MNMLYLLSSTENSMGPGGSCYSLISKLWSGWTKAGSQAVEPT